MVRTLSNAFETGRIPQAWMLTGVRGVGKTTTARILARGLNYQKADGSGDADHPHARARRPLRSDHGIAPRGRARDGRRLAYRHRRRPPDHRRHPLFAGIGPLQGLHHRRGPHALGEGVQRLPEDAGGAAAAREVHLRHHRDPQGPGHDPVPLPALRPAPHRGGQARRASGPHLRCRRRAGRPGGARRHRPRGRRLGARFALADGSGHRPWRRRRDAPTPCATCWGLPTARR